MRLNKERSTGDFMTPTPRRFNARITIWNSPRARLGMTAALMGMLAPLGRATAQNAGATASVAPAAQLQEIVVTAERRKSTVQKTPMSITAITGRALQQQGLLDMLSVAQQVPGVSFKTSGPGQTEYEMRGLTSTGGESPTVGVYLDDVTLTPAAFGLNGKTVIDPSLYDLDRVEVLRGPQGTLYGAGSMGGTIRFETNQPDPQSFSGSAESILSDTDSGGGFNHTENAMLNLPLGHDVAALRLVGTEQTVDGWIDRVVLNQFPTEIDDSTARGDVAHATPSMVIPHSNTETLRGGRAELLLRPTDRFTVTGLIMHQSIAQDGSNTIDSPPLNDAHYQPFNVAEPFADTFDLYSLSAEYDFDAFQVKSVTGYWDREQTQTQDISEAMQYYIGGFFGPSSSFPFSSTQTVTEGGATLYGFGAGSITEDEGTHQFSQELRLSSTGDGALRWVAGGYYNHYGAVDHVFSYYPISTTGFDADFGTNNLADNHRALGVDQYALYGQLSYELPYHLEATAGARYYTYHSDSATSVSGVSASGPTSTLYGIAQNSGVTPKATLAYVRDETTTVYATLSKGFRPGGPNSPIPVPPCAVAAPAQFGPDSVWNYELGAKQRMLGNRLGVSGDVYYEDWTGVQQEASPACGFNYTANAGTAHIDGAELEISWIIAPGLTVSQNAGYTHAYNVQTVPIAGVVAGDRLLNVPQVTANSSLTYKIPVGADRDIMTSISNSYTGSMQDITFYRNTLPAYDIVTFRGGLEADRWSAYMFIDNLGNTKALLGDTNALSANVSIFNRVTINQPRTIGVDLSYRF
jgi:iron complex outermembrane recepter protein